MLTLLKARWHGLVRTADLVPGRVLVCRVGGRLIGVVAMGSDVHVFDGRCPHASKSLHGAAVSDHGIVVCPRHGLRLALQAPCPAGMRSVVRLPFRIRDGLVEVDRGALR